MGMLEAEKALPGMVQVCCSSLILNGDSFNQKRKKGKKSPGQSNK